MRPGSKAHIPKEREADVISFSYWNGRGILANLPLIQEIGEFITSDGAEMAVLSWKESLPPQLNDTLVLHMNLWSDMDFARLRHLPRLHFARRINTNDLASLEAGDILYVCNGESDMHKSGKVRYIGDNLGFLACTIVEVWEGDMKVGSQWSFSPASIFRPQ